LSQGIFEWDLAHGYPFDDVVRLRQDQNRIRTVFRFIWWPC